nr:ribonuclease H-like domain-containing protein [Tanacetum cinerariifolium]
RTEGLDKTYDRFQKLISQLEVNGKVILQEDANIKLLKSLPSAWNNIALIMRNKPNTETLSMDDLYNNLKVYEAEIKGQSSSSSNSHNVAFVSSENTSSINEAVNAAIREYKLCFACVGFQTTPQMVINSPCLTDKKELASPGQTTTAKVKKVHDEVQIQALVDGKRVNIKESSIRHTLRLDDAEAPEEMGILQADAQSIPIPTEPSSSKPQKKHKPKIKHTKEPEVLDLEIGVLDIKSTYKAKIKKLESRVDRLEEENRVLKKLMGVHSTVDSDEPVMEKEESSKQERKIADIDADVKINLEKVQAEEYNLDLDHQEMVRSMLDVNDEEHVDVEEVLKVVTTAKLITKVDTTAKDDVTAASVEVPKPRKRKGVIIQDPEETTTTTVTVGNYI